MNKARLIERIAERTGMTTRQAEHFLDAFVETVMETLRKGDEVTIAGFGAFMAKFRSARMGVNPQNPKESMKIPAVTVPKFKAGKVLKDTIKHSHNEQAAATSSTEIPTATS